MFIFCSTQVSAVVGGYIWGINVVILTTGYMGNNIVNNNI